MTQLKFHAFSPALAPYFDAINREWINDMFALEPIDEQVLTQPERSIIQKGGKIWFAEHRSLGVVGTCALLQHEPGRFELTKMGVTAAARGKKVGEALLQYVLDQVANMQYNTLYLLTNKKCEAAIHLYEKLGFTHDSELLANYAKAYARCNVAMRYRVNS